MTLESTSKAGQKRPARRGERVNLLLLPLGVEGGGLVSLVGSPSFPPWAVKPETCQLGTKLLVVFSNYLLLMLHSKEDLIPASGGEGEPGCFHAQPSFLPS